MPCELRKASSTSSEAFWLRPMMTELSFCQSMSQSPSLLFSSTNSSKARLNSGSVLPVSR